MAPFGQTLRMRRRELRFALFAATTIVQFIIILAFSSVPLTTGEARTLTQNLPKPSDITALGIFENNVYVGIPMFTPAIGLGWFAYISLGTGLTISAIGITNNPPAPGWLLWVVESILPFFWLELMAYAVAIASGTMFLLTLIYDRRNIVHELSSFTIGIVMFILFLWDAASLEYYTITVASGNPNSFSLMANWISNISVGFLAVWAYSNVYGPRLRQIEWAILIAGLWLVFVFPLAYVVLALSLLAYVFWRKPSHSAPPQIPAYSV